MKSGGKPAFLTVTCRLGSVPFDPPEIDKELARQIAAIKQMHDVEGKTFRAIAAELGISKSQSQRLHGL